ncbi:MAG: hypothetical protein GVY04_05900 [Cyanobacteria bacterium]|nr:hypothetical protein [Cyanobacteria bacterium GSL.Bin1]
MMKLISSLVLAILTLPLMTPLARADDSLGEVIEDSIRDEIRDDIRDDIRRDICRRREEQGRETDVCDTLEDIDQFGDTLRRGRNRIRAIDAIFD